MYALFLQYICPKITSKKTFRKIRIIYTKLAN